MGSRQSAGKNRLWIIRHRWSMSCERRRPAGQCRQDGGTSRNNLNELLRAAPENLPPRLAGAFLFVFTVAVVIAVLGVACGVNVDVI